MADPDDDIRRARVAARDLAEVSSALEEMEAEAKDTAFDSRPDETQVREDAYHLVAAIRILRTKLRERIDAGVVAESIKDLAP